MVYDVKPLGYYSLCVPRCLLLLKRLFVLNIYHRCPTRMHRSAPGIASFSGTYDLQRASTKLAIRFVSLATRHTPPTGRSLYFLVYQTPKIIRGRQCEGVLIGVPPGLREILKRVGKCQSP